VRSILQSPEKLDRLTHLMILSLGDAAGLTREELGLQVAAYLEWLSGPRTEPFEGPYRGAWPKEVAP